MTPAIFTTERPPHPNERRANWAYKAAIANTLHLGPRFASDFESVFRREYERDAMAYGNQPEHMKD